MQKYASLEVFLHYYATNNSTGITHERVYSMS